MHILAIGIHQISIKDKLNDVANSKIVELNLFEKRDLMALLRGDPPSINTLTIGKWICCES